MTVLRFQRPYQYVNSWRPYTLFVDGVRTAEIRSGETADVPVSPGTHTVAAKIDWCSSNHLQLTCSDGEVLALEVGCTVVGWRWLLAPMYVTLLRHKYSVCSASLEHGRTIGSY